MKKAISLLTLATVCSVGTAVAQNDYNHGNQGHIKRVLLISIDGMHAVDFANCVNGLPSVNNGSPYCPALAALGKTGVNYVAASLKALRFLPGPNGDHYWRKPRSHWRLLRCCLFP
jgi:hypothetical protein